MCLYFIISHTSVMFLNDFHKCMYPHFVFNLSVISIKEICELTHNYGIIHTYFKVNPVIMTMSINSEINKFTIYYTNNYTINIQYIIFI
jgi:ribose/xylose/arabinose/galactoside ABC-type transport system permease subunit